MKAVLSVFVFSFVLLQSAYAQFAPQAGVSGSTAIHKGSTSLKAWANRCKLKRGFLDIATPLAGYTSTGDSSAALGMADGGVVSLGDSGVAVVQFAQALYNGPGADFAVFENGFQNPADPEEGFLELAFVEVSSDGEHFFRFPATSNTPTAVQVKGAGDYMNARLIHNLAGKYVAQYGTPFDLEELKSLPGLDVDNITHIRIVDVIGSVSGNGTTDQSGQKINDPYPTPYATGGFDLDAVGAINIKGSRVPEAFATEVQVFPNPVATTLNIVLPFAEKDATIVIADLSGKTVLRQPASLQNEVDVTPLHSGLYLIGITHSSGTRWIGKCSKI